MEVFDSDQEEKRDTRILLVEDNEMNKMMMDVHMPEMDGFEATKIIRDKSSGVLNHHIPIIALTGDSDEEDREICLEAGMNDYISKPIDTDQLKTAIERTTRLNSEIRKNPI